MKINVSPETGLPITITLAVIVEVIEELAANVAGSASMVRIPEVICTVIDFDVPSAVAVTTAGPVVNPGIRLTVATPLESVVAVGGINPFVVVKLTCVFAAGRPIMSRTVTLIVDVMLEAAAMADGLAVISICGSLRSTASKGMVCP